MNYVRHNFGSYSGYFAHLLASCNMVLGRYTYATRIDWLRITRFVFVCKGNVCRSPYAAAKTLSRGFAATSFGLCTSGQIPADAAAIRAANIRNVDLTGHRSTQFEPRHLQSGDLVLAFEPEHIHTLQILVPINDPQLSLVGIWPKRESRPIIADPFGKCAEYFDVCFDRIDMAVEDLLARTSTGRTAGQNA